jgi:hypothetical protein
LRNFQRFFCQQNAQLLTLDTNQANLSSFNLLVNSSYVSCAYDKLSLYSLLIVLSITPQIKKGAPASMPLFRGQ